jgi:hypothetical protein
VIRNTARATATADFCNKIGTNKTHDSPRRISVH